MGKKEKEEDLERIKIMGSFDLNRIKTTERGFNYVEVTPVENLNWGGMCVCNGCGKTIFDKPMKLVFVLTDTYCDDCFNKWVERSKTYSREDVDYDLKKQNEMSERWYKFHLDEDYRLDTLLRNKM